MLSETFRDHEKVRIDSYTGLTADYCKKVKASYILRGLRNAADFSYEQTIAQANDKVNGVDSVFLMCSPEYAHISSSIVRDIARNGGAFETLVPVKVI